MDSDSEDEKPRPALSGSESQSGSKSESDSDPPPRKGPQPRRNGLTSPQHSHCTVVGVVIRYITQNPSVSFAPFSFREASAEASCTETKASPGKASILVLVRQRQVELLPERLHPDTRVKS